MSQRRKSLCSTGKKSSTRGSVKTVKCKYRLGHLGQFPVGYIETDHSKFSMDMWIDFG